MGDIRLVGNVQLAGILGAIAGAYLAYTNNPTYSPFLNWVAIFSLTLGIWGLIFKSSPIKGEPRALLLGVGLGAAVMSYILYGKL